MRTLISNASLLIENPASENLFDVVMDSTGILEIAISGQSLQAQDSDLAIDAEGAALIPGLHDHHIHLLALKASLDSIKLGPPEVETLSQFKDAVYKAAQANPSADWIRGVGYVESVAGPLSREVLDEIVPDKAVRIQHRSGALWILNSKALEILKLDDSSSDGCLLRKDAWLNQQLDADLDLNPDQSLGLGEVGHLLNSFGVTGVTDATPGYGPKEVNLFKKAKAQGFCCDLVLMADTFEPDDASWMGPRKIILDDFAIPEFQELTQVIETARSQGRPVAIHSVTKASLALVAAALKEVGSIDGDRVEHASIAPPELVSVLAELGVTIVTQPNFIAERGDYYLKNVEVEDQPWLYRCQGWLKEGVKLAGGTDAPFGSPNPWTAIWAAVNRKTCSGKTLGQDEALNFESALSLFLSPSDNPGGEPKRIKVGERANLCLLSSPLKGSKGIIKTQPQNPAAATFINGKAVS